MARILSPSVFSKEFKAPKISRSPGERLAEQWLSPSGVKTAVDVTDVVGGTVADVVTQYSKKAAQEKAGRVIDYRQEAAKLAQAQSQKEAGEALGRMTQAWNAPGSGRLSARWSGGPMETTTKQYKRLLPRFPDDGSGRGGKGGRGRGGKYINLEAVKRLQQMGSPGTPAHFLLGLNHLNASRDGKGGFNPIDANYIRSSGAGLRFTGTKEEEEAIADPRNPQRGSAIEGLLVQRFRRAARILNSQDEKDKKQVLAASRFAKQFGSAMGDMGRMTGLGATNWPSELQRGRADISRENILEFIKRSGGGDYTGLVDVFGAEEKKDDPFSGGLTVKGVLKELGGNSVYPKMGVSKFDKLYQAAGRKHGVNPALLQSVAWYESRHNPKATSFKTRWDEKKRKMVYALDANGKKIPLARGLMQFIKGTGARYGLKKEEDFLDPAKSIDAGARYLKDLLRRYSEHGPELAQRYAVMAYNAGEGNVDEYIRTGGRKMLVTPRNKLGQVLNDPMEYGRHVPVLVRASLLSEEPGSSQPAIPQQPAPQQAAGPEPAPPAAPALVGLPQPQGNLVTPTQDAGPPPALDAGGVPGRQPLNNLADEALSIFVSPDRLVPDAGPPVPAPTESLGVPLSPTEQEMMADNETDWLDQPNVPAPPPPAPPSRPQDPNDPFNYEAYKKKRKKKKRKKSPGEKGKRQLREAAASGRSFSKLPKKTKQEWMRKKPRGASAFKWMDLYAAHKGNAQAAKASLRGE